MPGIDPSIALQVRTPQMPDPLESYAKLLQIQHAKAMQPLQEQAASIQNQDQLAQVAERQQQVQLRGQAAKSQQVVDSLMSNSMVQDPTTGAWTLDRPKFETALAQGGNGHMLPQLSESLDKMDESTRKASSARRQTIADALIAVHKAGNTAGALQTGVALLQKNNLIDASHAQPLLDAVDQGASPDQIGQMLQHIGQGMPEYQAALDREEKRKTDLVKEKSAQAKSDAETAKMAAETANLQTYGRPTAPEPPKAGTFEDYTLRFAKQLGKPAAALTPADIEKARKQYQQADDKPADDTPLNLTPGGRDMLAKGFLKTYTLPPLGNGKNGAKDKASIVNRAAELDPEADLASNKSGYEADRKSLDNITGTLDTLTSFEKTATKNLGQFVELAKRLPDTGMPWANTPLRLLTDKMVGAEWMPAINAARSVANREVARITNDPKLKGVLSDAARAEVDSLVPRDITFRQLVRVVPVLVNDMANVHAGLDEQKAAIQGRIKDPNGSSQTAPAAADPLGIR